MGNELAAPLETEIIESVMIGGDLSRLTPPQRVSYYKAVCRSLGLNPLTKPFDYITLNGKLTLYAKKDATEQLRQNYGVSITALEKEIINGCYSVTAHAMARDGRTDTSTGIVFIDGLKGEALANAMMKAETKAKRRVTLSICGLGMLDETEVSTIPDAKVIQVDHETGEIHQAPISAKIMDRWNELVAEAGVLGLKVPDITGLDEDALIQAGKEFKARIDKYKVEK